MCFALASIGLAALLAGSSVEQPLTLPVGLPLGRTQLALDPLDHDTRIKLASVLAGQRRFRDAMEELLEVVRLGRHQQADAARTQLLSLFTLAAADPALVSEYRRKLASALH